MTLTSHIRKLNRSRMIALLGDLSNNAGADKTLYLPAGLSKTDIDKKISAIPATNEILTEMAKAASKSKSGAAVFWGDSRRYLVLPPLPLSEDLIFDGYHIAPLLSQLQKDALIALVLVRLGESAVGVFQGEKRLSSKVGTGLVHSRHRQGGSSSQRFERHREKQMEMFFERVCSHAREHCEPYVKRMDYVVYGGEEKTLQKFRKQCRFMKVFDDRVLPLLLDVRKPRQATLGEAITEVWSSTLIEWAEETNART